VLPEIKVHPFRIKIAFTQNLKLCIHFSVLDFVINKKLPRILEARLNDEKPEKEHTRKRYISVIRYLIFQNQD
jgi:hypothetical protein